MRFLILMLAITFTITSCRGQKKSNHQNAVTMTQELDTFDIDKFLKNKKSGIYSFNNSKDDLITQEDRGEYYYQETDTKDNIIDSYKSFYKSGKLKDTGEFYQTIPVGKYTKYDENGQITEEKDHDKHYKFTLEDVLNYCKANGLVEKDIPGFDKKPKVTLARVDSSKLAANDPIYWEVMYGIVPFTPKGSIEIFSCVLKTTLDGKTGEVTKKEYKRIKKDKDWQLIED